MSKQKIEIEVDMPEGYEATGEWRATQGEPWLAGSGLTSTMKSVVPQIILRKLPDPIPEVEGPIGWPELKWAFKSSEHKKWAVFSHKPNAVFFEKFSVVNIKGVAFYADKIDWTPPPEIADLPPEKSLVKLTHECRWTFQDGEWIPSCTECYWKVKPTHCPECGRKVKGEAQ